MKTLKELKVGDTIYVLNMRDLLEYQVSKSCSTNI